MFYQHRKQQRVLVEN